MRTLALFLALSFSLIGAGCQTAVYKPGDVYHLSDVSVAATPLSTASPRLVSLVQQDLDAIVSLRPAEGSPRVLDVAIVDYHKKTAMRSLLLGDSNYVRARVRILTADSGIVQWEEDLLVQDTAGVNGVIGAVVAANQDRDDVETRLARAIAARIAGSAYGSTKPIPAPPNASPAAPLPAEPGPPEGAPEAPTGVTAEPTV